MNFTLHWKYQKITVSQRVLSWRSSQLSKGRSDRANIWGLVVIMHARHFKIVKSKILLRTSYPVFWWTASSLNALTWCSKKERKNTKGYDWEINGHSQFYTSHGKTTDMTRFYLIIALLVVQTTATTNKPAKIIISITVSIPLINDMCYLIPFNAMKKISQCHIKSMEDDNAYASRRKMLNVTSTIEGAEELLPQSFYWRWE